MVYIYKMTGDICQEGVCKTPHSENPAGYDNIRVLLLSFEKNLK